MTEPNQNSTQVPNTTPVQVEPPVWKKVVEAGKPKASGLFDKFYSNKKIFLPLSISFGLIIVVIIAGLIFKGLHLTARPTATPSPTPSVLPTPSASGSADILTSTQDKLNNLKNQINDLDVRQRRLQPPVVNFEIKF